MKQTQHNHNKAIHENKRKHKTEKQSTANTTKHEVISEDVGL